MVKTLLLSANAKVLEEDVQCCVQLECREKYCIPNLFAATFKLSELNAKVCEEQSLFSLWVILIRRVMFAKRYL